MASPRALEPLHAAVIDGRTDNVRYRQNELQKLHYCLGNNASTIQLAITKDADAHSSTISPESKAEYWLAVHATERHYESLDFEASMTLEYLISAGVDNKSRRIGNGLVVIRPTMHTRFYSIMVAATAAIAAGNCVALELAGTMLNVDAILRNLLPKALDPDTFCILDSPVESLSTASVMLVDQTSSEEVCATSQLPSNPLARAIAIVDRSADVEAAAKAIVTARCAFHATSPYSPDLVIVNDFVHQKFTEACLRHAENISKSTAPTQVSPSRNNHSLATKKVLEEAEGNGQISMSGSTAFKIVDVHKRASPITKMKVSGQILLVIKSSSLSDSINVTNPHPILLVLYTFSDPATAKFLSQAHNARCSYANSIPAHLLAGPAAPSTPLPPPSHHKYSTDMFSAPRPQYIETLERSSQSQKVLDSIGRLLDVDETAQNQALQHIEGSTEKRKVLQPQKMQPEGSQLGFFEQGLFLGAGLFLAVIVSGLGCGIWYLRPL